MNLDEFIKETIISIVDGVQSAQDHYREKTSAIVIPVSGIPNTKTSGIDFDIALSITEGTKTSGGAGVVIGILALGTQGASDQSQMSVSRVKFQIPVGLPVQNPLKK